MPFTLGHAAAVLPLRRLRLVTSGLVVGSFAPDFEYFLRLSPEYGFGHTLRGALVLTLPLSLLVLALFHAYVKLPVSALLPVPVELRLTKYRGKFHFRGIRNFSLLIGSILLGTATHMAWDSFTHRNSWAYRRWELLRRSIDVPLLGSVPLYKVLQHGSTVLGIVILLFWFSIWYRNTEPAQRHPGEPPSPLRKISIAGAMTVVAAVAGIIRATVRVGIPRESRSEAQFAGLLVVTAVAVLWWELVVYGFLWRIPVSTNEPEH